MAPRVHKGIEFLNQKNPGWHQRIDTDKLDINSIHSCILGQLYGSYMDGIYELWPEGDNDAKEYGLTLWGVDLSSDFDTLTRLWRYAVIKIREMEAH